MECLLRVTMLNRWLVTHQHQMDQHNNNNNHKSNNFINTFSHRLDALEPHTAVYVDFVTQLNTESNFETESVSVSK